MNSKLIKYQNEPIYLLFVGLLAASFFSATFLINRSISLDGGHWYWSASLRYFYTLLFLSVGFVFLKGFSFYKAILKEYIENILFWSIAGTIGFGFFYSLICYAADFSPAWVVATTWQMTILASLFVLTFFGKRLSKKIWFFTLVVFIGVTLVNLSHFDLSNLDKLLLGSVPILIAAFSYPIGNQLVWERKIKKEQEGEDIQVLSNSFAKVFLLILGSSPFWLILYFFINPTPPSSGQFISVALVSILSGIVATTLFLYARNHANTTTKLMLVDATQCGSVFFALFGEVLFLDGSFPNTIGWLGLFITISGLLFLTKSK